MGLSKKKFKKHTKINQEVLEATLQGASKKSHEKLTKFTDDMLFTTNTSAMGKDGQKKGADLKRTREKLKEDRFKQIEKATRSKGEEILIKRFQAKPETAFKKQKPITDYEENFGDLQDLWGETREVKPVKFQEYKKFVNKNI